MHSLANPNRAFATLRQLAQRPPSAAPAERCELCNARLTPGHRHLLEYNTRQIKCACDPCALRFECVAGGRFQLIPRSPRALPGFDIPDSLWDEMALPIQLAFILIDTRTGKPTALYPSPAGATESLVRLEAWNDLVSLYPALGTLEPDVEALLVNRNPRVHDHFIAPIDRCYALTGLIRTQWRGLSGGETVWREVERFFQNLRMEVPREEGAHA